MRFYRLFFFAAGLWNGLAAAFAGDYERADTLYKLADRVYSPAVVPEWIGDSPYFWYRNRERNGLFFYLVNAETGSKQRAADRETLDALIPAPWKPEKKKTAGADRPRKDPSGKVYSPDRKWTAYVRDRNVYICPAEGSKKDEIALSLDGTPGFAYESDLLWSPDSRKIATLKTRRVQTRRIPLLESAPENQLQPLLHWKEYAKPGDVLPVSLPVLFDVEKNVQIPLDTRLYESQYGLFLTGWRNDSRAFTFEFNQRGHQRYIVGEVDASDGTIRHLADEQSDTFVSYIDNFRYDLDDGAEMLWLSERDGWRHLYLLGSGGEVVRQLTRGEFVVRKVDYVDTEQRKVYLMVSGMRKKEDPYHLHYCRVNFDGTGFTDLTPENGNHQVCFSADRRYFVDVYSRPDLPPVSVLRRTEEGKIVATLETCDIGDLEATGWQRPEVFSAKGRDGRTDIWGTIYRPSDFDPARSYPVIECIYAGPHDSHVEKNFSPVGWSVSSLAELGFIVVRIDGMGTNNRSKKFHDVCWKNLKDAGFPDRIRWIRAAARKYPYMDLDRVGIYGWSAGGQNAMAALLFHNDFYRAAVAFCGCHDNRMDKLWWNELWMGYPVDESYSRSSNVDNAHLLKGDLLLVNGELDDNVDPASSLQVVDALIKAGKTFEQLYIPGKGHSLGGLYELHRMYDFFERHLLQKK